MKKTLLTALTLALVIGGATAVFAAVRRSASADGEHHHGGGRPGSVRRGRARE